MIRYIQKQIEKDLLKKMVLISGPRQCGKTTMVKELIKSTPSVYFNWDDPEDKKKILNRSWSDEQKIIALDEIHKYGRWKNFLKGTYDTQKELHQFIVTGSARLDIYKKGQDSMMGRFFSWRLHPLCLSELKHNFMMKDENLLKRLLNFGGFPEPFFSNDETFVKRWRKERVHLVFRQDIREMENIRDLSLIEIFYIGLAERVGSEIVLSNMARDLEIAPKTAKSWLNILEKMHTLFVIHSYSKNLSKAIVKAPKVYFYDNGEVQGEIGAKFENFVANHLIKKLHFLEDSTGDSFELNYLRHRDGHEVDFLICKNRRPYCLIEAKVSDESRSPSLYYFMDKLKIKKSIQLVMNAKETKSKDGITVINAEKWLSRKLEDDFFE